MWAEPLYTAEEMRAAEEAYEGPTLDLMERAGAAVAEAVLRHYPNAGRIAVCADRLGLRIDDDRPRPRTACVRRLAHDGVVAFLVDRPERSARIEGCRGVEAAIVRCGALPGRHAVVFTDKESHLSIYDACRLSGLKVFRYRHNDMEHLESLLRSSHHVETKWIAVVGTFGVTGESVRLADIVGLARKYGARIYLDDAHLIGVTGAHKRGLADSLNLLNDVDLIMGSFQMAFGNVGAFVAGPVELIDQAGMIHGFFRMGALMRRAHVAYEQCAAALRRAFAERRQPA